MHRALIRREGPRHTSVATFSARLFTFDSTWPRKGNPSREALSAAGFFYVGNSLITSVTDERGASVPLLLFLLRLHTRGATTDKTVCFHCGGGLKEWLDTDEPWKESTT